LSNKIQIITQTQQRNAALSVFIARQHTDARCWYSKSQICPSVRYVPVGLLYENGLTYCHSFFAVR